jgi:hypothetical protein
MCGMAEEGLLYGDRAWFSDARSPFRRMAVSSHPEAGLVVLSLWVGDTCTATFRLPMADAARLIASLADGMASSLPPRPVVAPVPPAPTRGWRALVARARARIRTADTPTLRRVK